MDTLTAASLGFLGGLVGAMIGFSLGARFINRWRHLFWHYIDDLIRAIEETQKWSPDGRIDPAGPLMHLYRMKQELRIPDHASWHTDNDE